MLGSCSPTMKYLRGHQENLQEEQNVESVTQCSSVAALLKILLNVMEVIYLMVG